MVSISTLVIADVDETVTLTSTIDVDNVEADVSEGSVTVLLSELAGSISSVTDEDEASCGGDFVRNRLFVDDGDGNDGRDDESVILFVDSINGSTVVVIVGVDDDTVSDADGSVVVVAVSVGVVDTVILRFR
jgi:hypothetical protein